MNWKEIKDKYPKAVIKLKYAITSKIDILEYVFEYDEVCNCDLYTFFDENNLIIEIGIDCTMEPKYCYKVHEHIETSIEWFCPNWSDLYLHREEAETAAFTKAFEILEGKQ